MTYWLSVTTRENFDASAGIQFSIDGFKNNILNKNKVNKIETEDKFACYIMEEYVFGCIYEATSKYDPDDKALKGLIWADEKRVGQEIYTLRFRTKRVLVLENDEMLDARSIVENLQFVKNKKYWGSNFHGSLREIRKKDFDFIEAEMKKQL